MKTNYSKDEILQEIEKLQVYGGFDLCNLIIKF